MERPVKTSLDRDDGHILPRIQHPAPLKPAKNHGLAWGGALQDDPHRTIVLCIACYKPLYIVYSDMEKAPLALGDWKVPERCDERCPSCGGFFAKFNPKTMAAQYLTSKGKI